MKKLITIVMIAFAAVAAKADLVLYWQVANYAFEGASYARLYGVNGDTETRLATMGLTEGAEATTVTSVLNTVAPFSDYSSYIVKILDSNRENTLAVSDVYALTDFESYIYNTGTSEQPPASPWRVDAFAVPEPTSGLLILLGLGALALKRKQA